MPILSKPTKKPSPFGKLPDRAKTMFLGHLDLEDLFFFSQCTKNCKELVIAEKVPAYLTWKFESWQATITVISKNDHDQFIVKLYPHLPPCQEALDESCKATRKGVQVLESNIYPGKLTVYPYGRDEWISATRGYSNQIIELFDIEKFGLDSKNYDPDALMHYMESVQKFKDLTISYRKVESPRSRSLRSGIQSALQEGSQPVWNLRSSLSNLMSRNSSRPGPSRRVNPDEQQDEQNQTFDLEKLRDLLNFIAHNVTVENPEVLDFIFVYCILSCEM